MTHARIDIYAKALTGSTPPSVAIDVSYYLLKAVRVIDGVEPSAGYNDASVAVYKLLSKAADSLPSVVAAVAAENPDKCSLPFSEGGKELYAALLHAENWGLGTPSRPWSPWMPGLIREQIKLAHWELAKVMRLYGYRDPTGQEYRDRGAGGGC